MKILHVLSHPSIRRGGAIQALRMARYMSDRGHSVSLILNRGSCDGLSINIDVNLRCIKLSLLNVITIYRIYSDHDIVHFHRQESLVVALILMLSDGRKRCFFQRGTVYKLKRKYLAILKSFNISIIAVSHAVKRALVSSGIREDKIHVVYGSVDIPSKVHSRKGGPGFSLGLVAAPVGKKGYPLFFKICGYIYNKVNSKFLVFGSNFREKFTKMYPNVDKIVSFMGYTNDIGKIYPNLTMLLCTSTKGEGLTGSVREAMAYMVPVASTPVAGNPEVVEDCKTGIEIGYDHLDSSIKILKFLFLPKILRVLTLNARVIALRKFHPRLNIDKLLSIYCEAKK